MSTLTVDTIQGKTTANAVAMPSGSVVQVGTQVAVNGLQTSVTSTSYTAVGNGLIASITPRFSNSKIKVHLTNSSNEASSIFLYNKKDEK